MAAEARERPYLRLLHGHRLPPEETDRETLAALARALAAPDRAGMAAGLERVALDPETPPPAAVAVGRYLARHVAPRRGLVLLETLYDRRGALEPGDPLCEAALVHGRRTEALVGLWDAAAAAGLLPDSEWVTTAAEQARGRGLPGLPVVTMPRSGTQFLGNNLALVYRHRPVPTGCGMFPDVRLIPARLRTQAAGGLMSTDHTAPVAANLDALAEAGITRLCLVVRDPRQATLSRLNQLATANDDMRTFLRVAPPLPFPEAWESLSFADKAAWFGDHWLPVLVRWLTDWLTVADADPRFRVHVTAFEAMRAAPRDAINAMLAFAGASCRLKATLAPHSGDHYHASAGDAWRTTLPAGLAARWAAGVPAALCRRFGWPEG